MSDKFKIEQPALKRGSMPGVPKYFGGSSRSVARLKNLNFDPIGELVNNYRELQSELRYQEKLRSGQIVELNAAGKPRAYRAEIHHGIYDKLISIGEKLLRYNYGRVPEDTDEQQKHPMPLIVNLTQKGDTYVVNDEPASEDVEDAEDDLPSSRQQP